jgi:hypothetical protein
VTDSSQNQWQIPTSIKLDSSGLWQLSKTEVLATTIRNQNAHLLLASPQSFTFAIIVSLNGELGLFDEVQMNYIKPLHEIFCSFFSVPIPKILCIFVSIIEVVCGNIGCDDEVKRFNLIGAEGHDCKAKDGDFG